MSQPESTTPAKPSFSPDWFVRGILTKLGETFDRFTGRNWKPSSSLATSQLIEKLKTLLDAEARDLDAKGKVVPHHIKLKMQWDKFSVDAGDSLKKLEVELLTAAIDHINDRRYHTYAPMQFEIKPDYFTEGVKLSASFDKFADEEEDIPEVNVTVPDLKNVVIPLAEEEVVEPEKQTFIASFTIDNKAKQINLDFSPKQRKSVGRTKESDLRLDDVSVSKLHAALVLNEENQLMVADTGSTNGTFINDVRIAYGKAIVLMDSDKLRFGMVEVGLRRIPKEKLEDELAAQISAREDFETKTKFSAGENVRVKNEYATNQDFSTNQNFSTNEVAISEQMLPKAVSSPPTAKLYKTNEDFSKEKIPTDERKATADFGEKIPIKPIKDEL